MQTTGITRQETGAKRAQQLQFLRFLAFLNVFIYHCDQWNVYGYPSANAGVFSVSFFFMLSGLVTAYSGFGKEVSLSLGSWAADVWKKLRKLYPLYAFSMLLPMVLSPLTQQIFSGDPGAGASLAQLAKCLLLMQSWFTEGYFAINGVGWFVSTLLFLSLFNLPGLWLLNRIRRKKGAVWILLSALAAFFGGAVVYCRLTRSWDIEYWHYIFPPARLGEYLGGMVLGFLLRAWGEKIPKGRKNTWLFTLLEIAAVVLWLFFLTRFGSPWRRKIVNWLIPNALLLSVFTLGRGLLSGIFRWKLLVWLGDRSYECFLIHNIILIRFGFYNQINQENPAACLAATLMCLGLTLLTAGLLHPKAKKA